MMDSSLNKKKKKAKVPHEYRDRVREGYAHSPVGSSRDSSDSEGYVRIAEDTTFARWVSEKTERRQEEALLTVASLAIKRNT